MGAVDISEGNPNEYLYPPSLLEKLDFSRSKARFNPPITAVNPGEKWMVVRPLQRGDYDKGFLELLSQLTAVGNVSRKKFEERFSMMKRTGGHFVTVIEDTRIKKLIGSATLAIEQKFVHECGLRAQLEDVVVNDTYRGKQLGKLIVATVTLLSEVLGCYKMSLECKDTLIPYYKSLGYVCEPGNANSMKIRFSQNELVEGVSNMI